MRWDLRDLELIKIVGDSGTLASAARQLDLTPSALSHRLSRLEEELHAPVFRRARGRMLLTGVGAKLYRSAGSVLRVLEHVEISVRADEGRSAEDPQHPATAAIGLPHLLDEPDAQWVEVDEPTAPLPAVLTDAGGEVLALVQHFERLSALGQVATTAMLTATARFAISRLAADAFPARHALLYDQTLRLGWAVVEDETAFSTSIQRTSYQPAGRDRFRLNGSKTLVVGADRADYLLVLAHRLGRSGRSALALLLVDPRSPGVKLDAMGLQLGGPTRSFRVGFEGVEVPAGHLLAALESDDAWSTMADVFDVGRLVAGATAVGAAEFCLGFALRRARRRRVTTPHPFDGDSPQMHALALSRLRIEGGRAALYEAARVLYRGEPAGHRRMLCHAGYFLALDAGLGAADAALGALGWQAYEQGKELLPVIHWLRLLRDLPVSQRFVLADVADKLLADDL